MKKNLVLLVIIVLAFVSTVYHVKPVRAGAVVTEADLAYFLQWFTVVISNWTGGAWVPFETRDFNYTDHWYAKRFVLEQLTNNTYHPLDDYDSDGKIQGHLKPINNLYYNESAYYAFYLIVGMEATRWYNPNEGFDDCIISMACMQSADYESKRLFFLDTIAATGPFRIQVYNGTNLIFDYPTEHVKVSFQFAFALQDTLLPEYNNADWEKQPSGSGSPPSPELSTNQTINVGDEVAKRLRIDYYGWNGTGSEFYLYRRQERLDWTVPTKWWVRCFWNSTYTVPSATIQKYVLGTEDSGIAYANIQHDNWGDVVIVYSKVKYTGSSYWVYVADFIFETGSLAKNVYWEADYFGSEHWQLIFNGTHGYETGDLHPYATNVLLEGGVRLNCSDATTTITTSRSIADNDKAYASASGNEIRGNVYGKQWFGVLYEFWHYFESPIYDATIRVMFSVNSWYTTGSYDLEFSTEIWQYSIRLSPPVKTIILYNVASPINRTYYFQDLNPLPTVVGSITIKLFVKVNGFTLTSGCGFGRIKSGSVFMDFDDPLRILGIGVYTVSSKPVLWQIAHINSTGSGTLSIPIGSYLTIRNTILENVATPTSYFWFWIINNTRMKIEKYSPLETLELNMTVDYNITAYFGSIEYPKGSISPTISCDLNMDGICDLKDYFPICKNFGKLSSDPDWFSSNSEMYDLLLIHDGKIDLKDVFAVSKQYGKSIWY